MTYYLPGPNFGYTIVRIDDHPWNTLITMKEIVKLEPGTIRFVGENAAAHTAYWREEFPGFFEGNRPPVFEIETKIVHPHRVESEPRRPFRPWAG